MESEDLGEAGFGVVCNAEVEVCVENEKPREMAFKK